MTLEALLGAVTVAVWTLNFVLWRRKREERKWESDTPEAARHRPRRRRLAVREGRAKLPHQLERYHFWH